VVVDGIAVAITVAVLRHVLTTTGFGDFSAATPVGHALALIEMLTGQLYLVTVIGVLIGNFVSRRTTT
jgi:hypothetical protein